MTRALVVVLALVTVLAATAARGAEDDAALDQRIVATLEASPMDNAEATEVRWYLSTMHTAYKRLVEAHGRTPQFTDAEFILVDLPTSLYTQLLAFADKNERGKLLANMAVAMHEGIGHVEEAATYYAVAAFCSRYPQKCKQPRNALNTFQFAQYRANIVQKAYEQQDTQKSS